MEKKTIGVLGGMGPESTALFYQQVIQQCRKQYGARYDQDFPRIVIYNLPIPNIFEKVEAPGKLSQQLVEAAKKLQSIGADFIVMPCNTVHYFYDNIKNNLSIPVLSIVEETANKVKSRGCKQIGILGTTTTIESGIYNKDLKKWDITILFPKQQNEVTTIIDHILTGKKSGEDKSKLKQIIGKLKQDGAEGVILGCTEFPLLLQQEEMNIEIFDTLNILAESTVRYVVESS
jgi:aspartate racemase